MLNIVFKLERCDWLSDLSISPCSRLGANPGAAGGLPHWVCSASVLGSRRGRGRQKGTLWKIRQDPHHPLQQTGACSDLRTLTFPTEVKGSRKSCPRQFTLIGWKLWKAFLWNFFSLLRYHFSLFLIGWSHGKAFLHLDGIWFEFFYYNFLKKF